MLTPIALAPNQPARFYRGGAGIARFRGVPRPGDHAPEDFIGSTTEVATGGGIGLSQDDQGRTLRDLEAARIDGAGHWRIFSRIMLPLARPSIGTVVVLNFMWVWNDFIYPLVYVDSADRYTIPLGILQYQSRLGVQWGTQMAALSVAAGVPLIVYLIFQRQFIRGVLAGSLKG